MDKPIIVIHDLETNEIIEREMNDAEFKNYQKDLKQFEKDRAEIKAQEEANAAEKQAILNRLGITAEEAALLLS
jgi:hypothetical protein